MVASRVSRELIQESEAKKGNVCCYYMRVLLLLLLCSALNVYCLIAEKTLLVGTFLSMVAGIGTLGFSDTSVRMAFGHWVGTTLLHSALLEVTRIEEDGFCATDDLLRVIIWCCIISSLWGIATGLGMNPGMTSGIAIAQFTKSTSKSAAAVEKVFVGATDFILNHNLMSWHWIKVIIYSTICCLIGFVIGNLSSKFKVVQNVTAIAIVVVMLMIATSVCDDVLQIAMLPHTHVSLQTAYLISITTCYIVGVACLPLGRTAATSNQTPSGLDQSHLVWHWFIVHVPGVFIGAAYCYWVLRWEIPVWSLHNLLTHLAVLLLVFVLSKICPLKESYFPRKIDNELKNPEKLHSCFKFIVRDFAGDTVYHSMHQPFLPRYGIFVCTFSWERAKHSLEFVNGLNEPGAVDDTLDGIVFWLKSIAMHHMHPQQLIPQDEPKEGNIDEFDIKNIILVATHDSLESCGLTPEEKEMILDYYSREINRHPQLCNAIKMTSDNKIYVTSIENSDGSTQQSLEDLKRHLLDCAESIMQCHFTDKLPIKLWCWLRDERQAAEREKTPPYVKYTKGQHNECHLPSEQFERFVNKMASIGELFIVNSTCTERQLPSNVIFYDVQFLIDFMKDLANIDMAKKRHRKCSTEWSKLEQSGKASKSLLQHHLKNFLDSKNIRSEVTKQDVQDHPLIQTMLQLDFLFFINDEFCLPQHLPATDTTQLNQGCFSDVSELLLEYIFDFGQFTYHHEYVFYRLVTRISNNTSKYTVKDVWNNWAHMVAEGDDNHVFTLICVKMTQKEREHNFIVLRVAAEFDKASACELRRRVSGMKRQLLLT